VENRRGPDGVGHFSGKNRGSDHFCDALLGLYPDIKILAQSPHLHSPKESNSGSSVWRFARDSLELAVECSAEGILRLRERSSKGGAISDIVMPSGTVTFTVLRSIRWAIFLSVHYVQIMPPFRHVGPETKAGPIHSLLPAWAAENRIAWRHSGQLGSCGGKMLGCCELSGGLLKSRRTAANSG